MRKTSCNTKRFSKVCSATGVPRCAYLERLVDIPGLDMTSHSGWQRLMWELDEWE